MEYRPKRVLGFAPQSSGLRYHLSWVGSALRADLGRSPQGERRVGARFIVHSFTEGAA